MRPFRSARFWKFVFGFLFLVALGIVGAFLAGFYNSQTTTATPATQDQQ